MNQEHAMNARSMPLPFARRLRGSQFVRFARPHRLCLRAERGTLWITVDGQLDDIELTAGSSRVFDEGAPVLVTAIGGDAVLTATPLASRPTWYERLAARLGPAAAVVGA
jgi:Protein of unknown function (DUF2917)